MNVACTVPWTSDFQSRIPGLAVNNVRSLCLHSPGIKQAPNLPVLKYQRKEFSNHIMHFIILGGKKDNQFWNNFAAKFKLTELYRLFGSWSGVPKFKPDSVQVGKN